MAGDSSWHYADVLDYIPFSTVQSISWLLQLSSRFPGQAAHLRACRYRIQYNRSPYLPAHRVSHYNLEKAASDLRDKLPMCPDDNLITMKDAPVIIGSTLNLLFFGALNNIAFPLGKLHKFISWPIAPFGDLPFYSLSGAFYPAGLAMYAV